MGSWQNKLLKVTSELEKEIDKQRFRLKQNMNLVSPATIQAYRGYGNRKAIYVHGRVLENEGLELPPKDATVWQNIRSLYHRFESDEIPNAKIEFQLENQIDQISCDSEGFFNILLSEPPLNKEEGAKWQKIRLRLIEPSPANPEFIEGEIQLQQPSNTIGIISDVDDTIIVSKATEFLDKMQIFLLRNSHTRKPLEGVAAFYRALVAGKSQNCQNPVFYVSGSSWNIYDVFDQFCEINHIPKGTFLLRNMGISKSKFVKREQKSHKLEKISHVLETFSDLPFVLIGDSGQKDPEIYQEVVNRFPGRIKVIYIRDVKPETKEVQDRKVEKIAKKLKDKGVEMLLIQNSMEAAKHAAKIGLIKEEALQEIAKESEEDKEKPADIGHLLGLDKFL